MRLLSTSLATMLVPLVFGSEATARLQNQETARLTQWVGQASLVSNPGPGETLFVLRAAARWSESAPRPRDRYAVQVTLPEGRVERRPLRPAEGPGSSTISVLIPARAVRNRLPDQVRLEAVLIDRTNGTALGPPLLATIEQFPTTAAPSSREPSGPFNRGRPLDTDSEEAQLLPQAGPDGWRFVRIASTADRRAFFLATTEASNQQVRLRLPDHDPNAGRSDEFLLDAPEQPAVNLTPRQAEAYLNALSEADPSGLTYRLPTRAEWQHAATAGQSTRFWWGDDPDAPEGANFFGPEPGEATDTTIPASSSGYEANPWSLKHTFGNVAEWTRDDDEPSVFVRMGGHFRTEPDEAIIPLVVDDLDALGPDPYVGLRPAFDLDAETGEALIRARLADEPGLAEVVVRYDPERGLATLSGLVAEPSQRRRAVDRLEPLWWLAAVEDAMQTPTVPPGRLARIEAPAGPARPASVLGRPLVDLPVAIRWDGPQPVAGSDWWVNIFGPNDEHFSHQLDRNAPGRSPVRITVPLALLDADRKVRVALSLGAPVSAPDGRGLVSHLVTVPVSP